MYKPQITRAKLYFTAGLIIVSSVALVYAIHMSEVSRVTVFDEIVWDDVRIPIILSAGTRYLISVKRLDNVKYWYIAWFIHIFYQENRTAPIYSVLETRYDSFPVNVTFTWAFQVNRTDTYYLMVANNYRCYVQTARFHVTIYKLII